MAAAHLVTIWYKGDTPHGVKYLRGLDVNQQARFARLLQVMRRSHRGVSQPPQTSCPLTEKELHQLRMDEEALKEMLEEEAMNKKEQEEKIRQEQAQKMMHSS
ncbi:hypothetical protein Tco_1370102 [Tanacetum coccineum]